MKILFLASHLNSGGISSYLFLLAKALKRDGHDIFLWSGPGKMKPDFESLGVECINSSVQTKCEVNPVLIGEYLKLKKFIRANGIDIVHANTRVTQVLAYFLSGSCKCAYVSTCHGFFKPRFSRRLFPAWGDFVIAISPQVKEHLILDLKAVREKVYTVYNGIDLSRFQISPNLRNEAREKLRIARSAKVAGMIARLSPVKGQEFFLRAVPGVLSSFPDSIFLIIGEGKDESRLKELSEKLNIGKSTIFLPAQNTLRLLSCLDCLVNPSTAEGLGLSVLEAQSAGIPVVAFATGGVVAIIENEKTGLLVKLKDHDALAEAIKRIFSDSSLAGSISSKAKQAAQRFAYERMKDETVKIYNLALAGKK